VSRTPRPGRAAIGVDIGGTKVLGVVVDTEGHVVGEARVPTPADPIPAGVGPPGTEVADAVTEVVVRLQVEAGRGAPVGVGVPGMLDHNGFLVFAPNLHSATGSDLAGLLVERLGGEGAAPPVDVQNDANCAALAEHILGAARGTDDALMVTLGTGIGGGIIAGGAIALGARGFAGEIGHMLVDPTGPPCPCGRRGCWERYASGAGLGLLAREGALAGRLPEVVALAGGDPEMVRGEHVTRAASDGDPGARAVMVELGWWVALGLANVTAVLDPERIILGGGLVEAGELFLDPTRRAFLELVEGSAERPPIEIVLAALGERAGAVGAALFAQGGWV
jgi:glucokinase